MLKTAMLTLIALAVMLVPAPPALAQEASPELRRRADQVVALLNGEADPAGMFTQPFLAQVPPAQMTTLARNLVGQYGRALTVERLDAQSAFAGSMEIGTERGVLRMNIAIEPQAPHRIAGLLVTGAELSGDTLEAVVRELEALPGRTSLAVARLDDGAPRMLAAHSPDRAMAIGSTFKLFILAELSRQVQAGERRWDEVVTLDRRSLPSGILQDWPSGSPLTLHTLAGLMISISDNTATDVLLHAAGRANVERMMATIGVRSAARNRPFLGTLEAFALKAAGEAEREAWTAADEAERRRLLDTRYAEVGHLDPARFVGTPLHIDTIEWFASADDLVRTMDWLRRNGDDTSRALLAISPGVGADVRNAFAYVGYKGGSEPGVLNLTWLLRNRAGQWHVVAAGWNNPEATLDDTRFISLVTRAVQQLR